MSGISASIVTDMLQAVILEGTGRSARRLPSPLAGKTGTTNDYRDALFVGYAPSLATGVWVGNDDGTTLGPKETGGRAALPIWKAFMEVALAGQAQQYFDMPEGVHRIHINPKSGTLLEAGHPGAIPVLVRNKPSP